MAGSRAQTLLRPSRDWTPLTQVGALTLSAGVITDVTRLAGVEGDGEAYPDSSVGVWPAATNIVRNGNCTSNSTDWGGAGAGTSFSRITTDSKFSGACAQAITAGSGTGEGMQVGGAVAGNYFALSAATVYANGVWVKGTVGALLSAALSQYTAAAAFISDAIVVNFVATGDWQKVEVTGTTDGTCAQGRVRILTRSSAQAVTIKAGGVQVELNLPTPYIETDGGTASRVAGTVAAPRQFLNPDGGGMAIRYRAGMAYTGGVSSATRIRLLNAVNGNNWTSLYYEYVTDKWLLGRDNGSGAGETVVSGVQSFALGDTLTIIAEWTSTLLSIQIDNAAPVTAASTKAPLEANLPATFGFGTSAEPPWGDLLWAYGWRGVLSTADRALLVALGNNDPLPHQLRGAATPSFLARFNGDGTAYRYKA